MLQDWKRLRTTKILEKDQRKIKKETDCKYNRSNRLVVSFLSSSVSIYDNNLYRFISISVTRFVYIKKIAVKIIQSVGIFLKKIGITKQMKWTSGQYSSNG